MSFRINFDNYFYRATRQISRKSVSWTQKHSTLPFLKTDIAFIVSFEVYRINDESSPKVISKPRGNSVYLTVVLDVVVVSKYRLVNIDPIRNKKNNISLVRKTFYRTSILQWNNILIISKYHRISRLYGLFLILSRTK